MSGYERMCTCMHNVRQWHCSSQEISFSTSLHTYDCTYSLCVHTLLLFLVCEWTPQESSKSCRAGTWLRCARSKFEKEAWLLDVWCCSVFFFFLSFFFFVQRLIVSSLYSSGKVVRVFEESLLTNVDDHSGKVVLLHPNNLPGVFERRSKEKVA